MTPNIVRSALADGREVLYFFDGAAPGADPFDAPGDPRVLPERPRPAQLRYDPLLDEWVSFAAHRQDRTHLPPADECPLCPGTGTSATEVPADHYDVVVFENRFPSLGPGQHAQHLDGRLGAQLPAYGRCEVVVFGPDHAASLAGMAPGRVRTVVEAWAHRTRELSALPGIRQVFPFENRGAQIGVTLHHPHGQIYAYPYVAPRIKAQLAVAREHRRRTGSNLFADVLQSELAAGSRVVAESDHWVAYVPFAARMPVEVHLVPRRHVPDLAALTGPEKDGLAAVYHGLLQAVDGLYPAPTPYISAWYQAPAEHPDRDEYRLHLQLTSPRRADNKLKYLAGSEAAMGAFIADVLPEETAERLRRAWPATE